MRQGRVWLVTVLTVLCLVPQAYGGELELLSRSAFGSLGNGASGEPAVSADGRFVAFTSDASNLVDGDFTSWYWKTDPDIFLLDRNTGTLENASVALNPGGYWFYKTVCRKPTIDGSGARLAFECFNGYHAHGMQFEVYLLERPGTTLKLVSAGLGGRKASGASGDAALSADGTTLAFASLAANLHPADSDAIADIYLYDLTSATLQPASLAADGRKGNGASSAPALSSDGRLLAFASAASNLVADDVNGVADIFVRDRASGVVQRFTAPDGGSCAEPTLSGDGSLLAFSATAPDGRRTIYLVRSGGRVEAVAAGSAPALSADGRTLAYVAPAAAPLPGGLYRRDLLSGRSELVSVTPAGLPAGGSADAPALSAHGAELVFAATAADLVDDDSNGVSDIFLATASADTTPPTIELALSRSVLWPPNHKFVPVQVAGLATDDRELADVEITVSDEYGSAINQVVPGFGSTVWLEAWRDGDDSDGRVYTITVVAVDAAGNRSETSATVVVPHAMAGK